MKWFDSEISELDFEMNEIHDPQSFVSTFLKNATKFWTMKSDEQELLLRVKVEWGNWIVKIGLIWHLL